MLTANFHRGKGCFPVGTGGVECRRSSLRPFSSEAFYPRRGNGGVGKEGVTSFVRNSASWFTVRYDIYEEVIHTILLYYW